MELKKNSIISWLSIFAVNVIVLVNCPVSGQSSIKRSVTEADYVLWNRTKQGTISTDGKWVTWSVQYDNGTDTLFVSKTDGKKRYYFPKGGSNFFYGKNNFACSLPNNMAIVTNLKRGEQCEYESVESIAQFGQNLILYNSVGDLSILDAAGKTLVLRKNIKYYSVSPEQKVLLYVAENNGMTEIRFLKMYSDSHSTDFLVQSRPLFDTMAVSWSDDESTFVVAVKEYTGYSVLYYNMVKGNLQHLNTQQITQGKYVDVDSSILLLDQGRRIFLTIRNNPKKIKKEIVEVWNAADKLIHPKNEEIKGWSLAPMIAMWTPETGNVVELTNEKLPKITITSNGKHAILWNPNDYEPQYEFIAEHDFYVQDLETGERKLVLSKQSDYADEWSISPKGGHITYFKDNNWWDYDIAKNIHFNIGELIKKPMGKESTQRSVPFARPVWDKYEKSLLISDDFDIWMVSIDERKARRLTNGRESKKVFRLPKQVNATPAKSVLNGWQASTADLDKILLFSCISYDFTSSGFYQWQRVSGLKKITYSKTRNFDILFAANTATWFTETFEQPAQLFSRNGKKEIIRISETIFSHKQFLWGRAKRLEYRNGNDSLAGILYYPAEFDSMKKYPMIVNVYEKQSQRLNFFIKPSLYNGGGLNISNFTSNGYFVLLPDVVYETGKPGASAVRCVEAALDSALAHAPIDCKRIGLAGYSFGGYEANYIASHSNRFATIVSGAGFSDFISSYHSVAQNYGIPEYFRFETFQMRMGKQFADDKVGYVENSPLYSAENISTPLLLYAGLKDKQVSPEQSIELHLALRRLGKDNILLLYPEEGHSFNGLESQVDITKKLEAWFDHYLKDYPKQDWMTSQ